MTDQSLIPFRLSGRIFTTTHVLSAEAFAVFDRISVGVRIDDIKPRSLLLEYENRIPACRDLGMFLQVAHVSFSAFVVALNISCAANFSWMGSPESRYAYDVLDPTSGAHGTIIQHSTPASISDFPITADDIGRAALVYGALAGDRDQFLREEFVKGLLHLDFAHYGLTFLRDAFNNFYRVFEYAVVKYILLGRPPKNELGGYSDALRKLNLNDDFVREFRKMYALRGEQIAHAQAPQSPVSLDDVMKMKLMAGLIANVAMKPRWEEFQHRRQSGDA